ncbi:hypothetical protein K488DRAFT_71924 [Vararia minispora EC-137]|uniref:Uncharacterized protein n=1 Tax=Vararia minispora EC-137 TaxID=1314806 RepID=A0ACB8QGF8_9AGAM|nr:hypothetical protein K488DRAFT_71924 [Vararia minispora EC-137]
MLKVSSAQEPPSSPASSTTTTVSSTTPRSPTGSTVTAVDQPPPPSPGRLAKVLRAPYSIVPAQRSASLQAFSHPMGAAQSQPQPPPSPSKVSGGRLRRVFAARRKKADDVQAQLDVFPASSPTQPKPRAVTAPVGPRPRPQPQFQPPLLTTMTMTALAGEQLETPPPLPLPKSPRMLLPTSSDSQALTPEHPSHVLSAGDSTPSPSAAPFVSANVADDTPPAQAPTEVGVEPLPGDASAQTQPSSQSAGPAAPAPVDHPVDGAPPSVAVHRAPPPLSPEIEQASPSRFEPEPRPDELASPTRHNAEGDKKDDWRKSDATLSSYHTVRPRSVASGGRTRPVSMAESLQSNSTVVASAKRLSALLTEAEFVMTEAEEDDEDEQLTVNKARKRHSISLQFTAPQPQPQHSPSPPADPSRASSSAVTRAAAAGIIGTSAQKDGVPHSPASQIRGRLAAWTTHPAPSPSPTITGGFASPPPPPGPTRWFPEPPLPAPAPARAPPPSGMLGFGKRMARALGMSGGSHNQGPAGYGNNSPPPHPTTDAPEDWRGRPRRTPNAPSGTWSISTTGTGSTTGGTASFSSSEDGPGLGERMRAPLATRGLVFAQPLGQCVRHTALEPVRVALAAAEKADSAVPDPGVDASPEERMLPALVVRCVQHIMKWGLEEEGLFRISGRASHVAKLRAEFDTGADYDLRECPPGDLDPHAVSSVFKAYLRELPEPILTKQLNPLFEAAMATENEVRRSLDGAALVAAGGSPASKPRRPTLPSNPRDTRTLLKPPSLTTLALPNFAGMRPPSATLLDAFASLIAQLPRPHRDLLKTVTELIRATAARRETRMPLSNLTVVFCPSLAMSPPILRVLCESEDIWHGPRNPISAPIVPVEEIALSQDEEGRSKDSADDAASCVSSAREPWPPLSSPSSSSLATPNDDSASSVSPPVAFEPQTDDELEVALQRATMPFGKTPFPSIPMPPAVPDSVSFAQRLASRSTSSNSSLLSSSDGSRRGTFITAPMSLSQPVTAPSTPADASPAMPPLPLAHPGAIPRPKKQSITVFAKRSLSSLRQSRVLGGLSRSTSTSGSASPAAPLSPLSPDTEKSRERVPLPSASVPPVIGLNFEMSPLAVPAVLREEDAEVGMARTIAFAHLSASSPNLTTPDLPAAHPYPLPRTQTHSREAMTAKSPTSDVGRWPPSAIKDVAPPPATTAEGILPPLGDLSGPCNRLSLWEDADDSIVDDEWASSVLLAADAGWLGKGSAHA